MPEIDTNLKNQIIEEMTRTGRLSYLKLQTRTAIHNTLSSLSIPFPSKTTPQILKTQEGKTCIALVVDLLNFLKLESTKFTLKSELGFDEADLVNLDSFRKEGKKEEAIMMGIASDLLNADINKSVPEVIKVAVKEAVKPAIIEQDVINDGMSDCSPSQSASSVHSLESSDENADEKADDMHISPIVDLGHVNVMHFDCDDKENENPEFEIEEQEISEEQDIIQEQTFEDSISVIDDGDSKILDLEQLPKDGDDDFFTSDHTISQEYLSRATSFGEGLDWVEGLDV